MRLVITIILGGLAGWLYGVTLPPLVALPLAVATGYFIGWLGEQVEAIFSMDIPGDIFLDEEDGP